MSCQEYAFTLGLALWLNYECFTPFIIELLFETLRISWQNPSLRKEIIVIWKHILQIQEIPRQ